MHDRIRVVDYAAGFEAGYLKREFLAFESEDWRKGWLYGVAKRVQIQLEIGKSLQSVMREIMARKEKEA